MQAWIRAEERGSGLQGSRGGAQPPPPTAVLDLRATACCLSLRTTGARLRPRGSEIVSQAESPALMLRVLAVGFFSVWLLIKLMEILVSGN